MSELWTLDFVLFSFLFSFLLFWKQGLEFSITLQLQLQIVIWHNLVSHICHSHTVTQSYVMRNNSRRFWKKWYYIVYYTHIDFKTDTWLLLWNTLDTDNFSFLWFYINFVFFSFLIFFWNDEVVHDIAVTWHVTWCDIIGLEHGRRI